ncbi:MAG TPA: pyridoxal phosphate-dependent aminotransferase [Vicinamibacterales bacterium]|nr:pyridoxal phosphate-dependent aminotransferase [Vicinamibacterales bacterium]
MISSRLPKSLEPNAVARAIDAKRRSGAAILDLTETNPTSAGFNYPKELLEPLADPRALEYDPQPLGLWSARAAVAADFRRRGIVISADRVALTSSTSEAYALLFKLLCDAGDAVLVPHPSYPLFEHLTQLESVTAIPYALEYHGAWRVDVDSITRAATDRVRAILIVSPNNPTGSFLHQDDLDALSNLAASRGWAIIGDEVFADYPLDPAPEAANVLAGAGVLTFSLGGLSKAAGLPQLKLGWIGFGGPSSKVDEALAAYEVIADTYLSVSTPVQAAAADLIERGAAIRSQIMARVQRNLESLRKLATAHPSVGVLRVEGGWSAVAQVPQLRAEEALVLELLEKDDVLVHPGYFFDFDREAFVVVSLLVEPATFDQAVTRLLPRAAGAKS